MQRKWNYLCSGKFSSFVQFFCALYFYASLSLVSAVGGNFYYCGWRAFTHPSGSVAIALHHWAQSQWFYSQLWELFFFSWGWKTRPLVCWGFRVHTTWRLPRGPKFIHSRLLWCCLSLVVLAHKAWIWTLNLSPKSNYYFKDWFIWGVAVQFCEIKDVPP